MRLGQIAHVRTGDKGDISQISVIAFQAGDYELIRRSLSGERVLAHLPGLSARAIHRYEVPTLNALNFVIEGALVGGVTRSLALDAHGKTLGMQLLDLEL